jgi:hypothetical protein
VVRLVAGAVLVVVANSGVSSAPEHGGDGDERNQAEAGADDAGAVQACR